MSKPRSTQVSIKYFNSKSGKSYSLNDYIESFSYTDNATGSADTVEAVLYDRAKKLIKSYYPGKEDMMTCFLTESGVYPKKKMFVNKQEFHVDRFSYQSGELFLQGISVPKNSSFSKTPRTKTWESVTLDTIAKQLCDRAKIKLFYRADTVKILKTEQTAATDLAFITSLCETFGFGIKIYADKLIVFREADCEKKEPVSVIRPENIIEKTLSADVELIRTYTGFRFTYKSGENELKGGMSLVATPKIIVDIGECENREDGIRKGRARVNEANKDMILVTFQCIEDPRLMATSTIKLDGFGHLDGKYYIKQVRHNYSADSGYTQSIEARKVIERL